ncbi:hypothetical protein ECG_09728 [Echinococcus granulosus]|nr:hypothetical protein ECG_09728 [Echinococcus granulosus]
MSTEERFMQILYNYSDSSAEDKHFLIVNCDNVYHDRDDPEWLLSLLNTLAGLLEEIDLNSTSSRHKLPDVPSDSSSGRSPWTFTPHNAQYISYLMSRLLVSRPVDVRSRNLIHKVVLRLFRNASGAQVKASLLRFSKYFARFLTPAEVKDFILPLVTFCLNSRNLEALIQSVAVQCMANILPQLPLATVENVLLPFALQSIVEAANGNTVRVCSGGSSERAVRQSASYPARDASCLIPGYLNEFDFFLSEGEPVISLCCLLKAILRERRTILSPSMIAMEILPCLLPHTLNKQWQFSEFKYIMSTLYEYLNYLNETNLPPSGQNLYLQSSQKEELKQHDQAIKVCVEGGSVSDEDGSGGMSETCSSFEKSTFSDAITSEVKCKTLMFDGQPLTQITCQLFQVRRIHLSQCPQMHSKTGQREHHPSGDSNKDDNSYLTPHRVNSSSTASSEGGFKSSSSTQHLLSNLNLLTVTVCEGPFGLPDKNRRRSAIDLRSVTEMLSSSPLPTSTQQLSVQTSGDSAGKYAAKLNIFGVIPNIRRASENALNKPNQNKYIASVNFIIVRKHYPISEL